MAPGALEPSSRKCSTWQFRLPTVVHTAFTLIPLSARAKGMTDQEYAELIAIVGMASETNRLVTALGVAVDDAFLVNSTKGGAVGAHGRHWNSVDF